MDLVERQLLGHDPGAAVPPPWLALTVPGRFLGVVLIVVGAWLATGSRWAPKRILGQRLPSGALSEEGRRDVGRILRIAFLALGLILLGVGIVDLIDLSS